jgi:uncharacterized membrane protein
LRADLDRHGNAIPAEYSLWFNSTAFCWWGFLFPFLWPFWKGLITDGLKYCLIGWTAYGLFTLNGLHFSWGLDAVIEIALFIALIHLWCGFEGHRHYSRFLNTSSASEIAEKRVIGVILALLSLAVSLAYLALPNYIKS